VLSYQHMYHAGGLADVHKHVLLARALAFLVRDPAPLLYAETHSGRGRYFLDSPPAQKTGEAARGIQRLLKDRLIAKDEPFLKALRLAQAGNSRLYPGSPLVAATMLRSQDRLWLWELHSREHGWLSRLFADDTRVRLSLSDGLAGLPLRLPPRQPDPVRGLALIDPSYETKAEYEALPGFVARLRRVWPRGSGILWYPMLPAGRHEGLRASLLDENPNIAVNEITWSEPKEQRGLFGSGVVSWGLEGVDFARYPFRREEFQGG
jgi:23S rRNA (adenine2030-N6)-methyltransferase